MALAPGSQEIEGIRGRAVGGDQTAMEEYVYWTLWQNLQRQQTLSIKHRRAIFRSLVETVDLKVTLDG